MRSLTGENMKRRTLRLLHKEGSEKLCAAGVPEANLDAWLLLEYVTGIGREKALADPDLEVSETQEDAYKTCIEKRAQRIPLQQITGEQEFFGLSFFVNDKVLIPRQDTEILVEAALDLVRPGMKILDLCTGSGCVLLSILHEAGGKVTGTGTDISGTALSVARKNAARLHLDAEFIQSDLFQQVDETYDMIVANPPYIPTAQIDQLQEEVRLHDPKEALDGGEDGLKFIRQIVRESPDHLNVGGRLLFEIGYDQGRQACDLMTGAGFTDVGIKKDLADLDRVVSGRYNI